MLLRSLSLHPSIQRYESTPVASSIHPSLRHLFDGQEVASKNGESSTSSSRYSTDQTRQGIPTTLTLVLVCRSLANAEKTKKSLLAEHQALLLARAKRGELQMEGWWEALDIRCESCDFSSPGGDNGIMQLCRRLNAGYVV